MSDLIVPGGRTAPAPKEPEPKAPIPCTTAFVVYQLPDGRIQVSDDLDVPLQPQRKPVFDEIYMFSAIAMRDVHVHEGGLAAANATIGTQINMGRQAAAEREAQLVQQKLEAEERRRKQAGR